jgi:hypothetical protein
MRKVYKTY